MTAQIKRVTQASALIVSLGAAVLFGYNAVSHIVRMEDGVFVQLPAVSAHVERHDGQIDKVGDAIERLTDAALVGKAKKKARRAECMKFVELGKLHESDCPEVEE